MALTDNIIAYYKLDESSGNAADSVGARTLTNNNTVGFATGKINNAGDFGTWNTSKYFSRVDDFGLAGGAMSFSLWVKLESEIGSDYYWIINQVDGTTGLGFRIYYEYNAGTPRLRPQRVKGYNGVQGPTVTTSLGTSWHHLVMTYDTTNINFYLDGSLAGGPTVASGAGDDYYSGDSFYLGATPDPTAVVRSDGLIDEVGVWSRALSSTEVTELYNSGAGLTYPFSVGSPATSSRKFTGAMLMGVGA